MFQSKYTFEIQNVQSTFAKLGRICDRLIVMHNYQLKDFVIELVASLIYEIRLQLCGPSSLKAQILFFVHLLHSTFDVDGFFLSQSCFTEIGTRLLLLCQNSFSINSLLLRTRIGNTK